MSKQENKSPEEVKLVVLGIGGVGKTSWTHRICYERLIDLYDPGIEDTLVKLVQVDQVSSRVEILDSMSEQYELPFFFDSWVRAADGVLLLYSITDKTSFEKAQELHSAVLRLRDGNQVALVVAGNKCDLEHERVVSKSEGQELAGVWECKFFEMSAKENVNCTDVLTECVREIRKLKHSPREPPPKKASCAIC
eukprot:TRINITY_DN35616_c0_g1_i1.p1 TRINITY_DN35616_c0_g1~~TRINITY_DN35616_c0_g1_i1.p1  ORF type:complete len:194 (+),score=49.40 TRINITY_DN35616_c0_g1_i1:213-794(+)